LVYPLKVPGGLARGEYPWKRKKADNIISELGKERGRRREGRITGAEGGGSCPLSCGQKRGNRKGWGRLRREGRMRWEIID